MILCWLVECGKSVIVKFCLVSLSVVATERTGRSKASSAKAARW